MPRLPAETTSFSYPHALGRASVPTVFKLLAALERTIAKPPTIGGLTCTLAWSSWHLAPLLLNYLAPSFHSVPVVVPPQSSSDKIRVTAEGRQPRNVSKQ